MKKSPKFPKGFVNKLEPGETDVTGVKSVQIVITVGKKQRFLDVDSFILSYHPRDAAPNSAPEKITYSNCHQITAAMTSINAVAAASEIVGKLGPKFQNNFAGFMADMTDELIDDLSKKGIVSEEILALMNLDAARYEGAFTEPEETEGPENIASEVPSVEPKAVSEDVSRQS